MRDRTLKLLLIDPDRIYRTGLRVVFEQFSELQVVAEAETIAGGLQLLTESDNSPNVPSLAVDLVLLELSLDRSQPNQSVELQDCRQLKTQYPNLPVLLLSSLQEPSLLAAARQAGVDGYYPKGAPVSEIVAVMRQVAAGGSYWAEVTTNRQEAETQENSLPTTSNILIKSWNRLRFSGVRQIDATLAEVTAQLQIPGLPVLDRALLAGQRRELLASRWILNKLLAPPESRGQGLGVSSQQSAVRSQSVDLQVRSSLPSPAISPVVTPSQLSLKNLRSALFKSTRAKLQFSLENLTRTPLEIDIFREEKKRELLTLILRKIEDFLEELRFSQVQMPQLKAMQSVLLRDLWQAATIDFFGRYSTLQVGDRDLEIVSTLLQDAVVVQTGILDKIPLVFDLFSYLLFKTPLVIDNVPYPAGSPEAMDRAETILQNLLIQLANGVVQPLLNRFADVEEVKQSFYDRRLISTREVERFRNNLSWKYRLENYIGEPQKIFESRYELFVLVSRGIAKISVYAPRSQELKKLSGIPLLVTLALELRDAIAPRLRAAVAFIGSGVVYVLTQVIGRAIGLIGRGILQGLGGALQESKNKRF
jgi:DNA-binding NarL/FixJ family response regulator